MEICTHEELTIVITVGYSHPQNVSPQKFNPQNNVTTKNCTFTVYCVAYASTGEKFSSKKVVMKDSQHLANNFVCMSLIEVISL